jgi:hypothetical protein
VHPHRQGAQAGLAQGRRDPGSHGLHRVRCPSHPVELGIAVSVESKRSARFECLRSVPNPLWPDVAEISCSDREPVRDTEPAVGHKAAVDLYWIPLGTGAHVVRISGKVFETASALVARRPRCDLYHSALVICASEIHFVIEQAPIPDLHGERRGVVAEGPVGMQWLGRFRVFRYENRRWRDGQIPDRRSEARSGSLMMSTSPDESSRRCPRYRPPCGAVTSST